MSLSLGVTKKACITSMQIARPQISLYVLYLTTFQTPTLLFLYFLVNQAFKFKNTLEYIEIRFPGNTCQFS